MTEELPPLRDRVRAPEKHSTPTGPRDIRWRAITLDDAPVITELAERISRRDHPTWSESLDEVREDLSRSWVDLSRDGVLALDAEGLAVAWGLVVAPPNPETLVRVYLSGGVDPRFRGQGVGQRLLAWQHGRAQTILATSERRLPGWVLGHAPDCAPEAARLLQHAGFEPARYFTTLECDLTDSPPSMPFPVQFAVEPFSAARSEAVRAAKNAAFADHWGSQPASREGWESMQSLGSFRADLSRIAVRDNEVAAFVITEVNEEDWERQGSRSAYIGLVGTLRAWRGHGLASALLSEVMNAYRAAGLERAVLDVDADNATGALGVYTRLGFSPTAREVSYRVVY